IAKCTTLLDRDAHCLKIVGSADAITSDILLSGRWLRRAFDQEIFRTVRASQRDVIDCGCGLNSRQSLYALDEVGVKMVSLWFIFVLCDWQVEIRRHYAFWIETRVRLQERGK